MMILEFQRLLKNLVKKDVISLKEIKLLEHRREKVSGPLSSELYTYFIELVSSSEIRFCSISLVSFRDSLASFKALFAFSRASN